jgi:acetamidase/formamidase
MTDHYLPAERLHFAWDNSLAPLLEIEPGDTVSIDTWDASGHFFTRSSTSADVARPRPHAGHALSGPIGMRGARAGDTFVLEVLDVSPAEWGWTALGPRGGLLPEDFPEPYLRLWDLSDGRFARGVEGVRVALAPFCGVMGVALAEPGEHSTIPPRRVGGKIPLSVLKA